MTTINEIQLKLQNSLKRIISQAELGKALGTGRANISLRIKNKSEIKPDEIKKLETYFNINLINPQPINIENDQFYAKSLQILDAAKGKEIEFYYGLLKQGQKGIDILKT